MSSFSFNSDSRSNIFVVIRLKAASFSLKSRAKLCRSSSSGRFVCRNPRSAASSGIRSSCNRPRSDVQVKWTTFDSQYSRSNRACIFVKSVYLAIINHANAHCICNDIQNIRYCLRVCTINQTFYE